MIDVEWESEKESVLELLAEAGGTGIQSRAQVDVADAEWCCCWCLSCGLSVGH
jgi:streptolysin S family bacteriocin protoxin